MAANTMLKRVGARTHPCFTPFVTGNESEVSPLSIYVTLMPSCNWRTSAVNFLGQPNFSIICYSSSLQTVSNALVKSMNVMKRSSYCSWHFSCSWRQRRSYQRPHGHLGSRIDSLEVGRVPSEVDYQAVEQHPCQYLPCYGQERDSSVVVVTKLAISLFVEADDGRIFQLLRYYFLIPHTAGKVCQLL